MHTFTARPITIRDIDVIQQIDASQLIRKAWRPVDGKRVLVDIDYHDPDWPNGYAYHEAHLKATIEGGGCALGAFDPDGRCIGMVTVDRPLFGTRFRYALLDQLFISRDKRGSGIGKKLFMAAAQVSKTWGANKLYICAGSAEETIAFYNRIGCTEALEIQQALAESDPRDIQMEFDLSRIPTGGNT